MQEEFVNSLLAKLKWYVFYPRKLFFRAVFLAVALRCCFGCVGVAFAAAAFFFCDIT
jgi:hypothetical protein